MECKNRFAPLDPDYKHPKVRKPVRATYYFDELAGAKHRLGTHARLLCRGHELKYDGNKGACTRCDVSCQDCGAGWPDCHFHCCCPDNLANNVRLYPDGHIRYAHDGTQFPNLDPTRPRSHSAYYKVVELSPTERKQILEHVRILVTKIAKLTKPKGHNIVCAKAACVAFPVPDPMPPTRKGTVKNGNEKSSVHVTRP